MISHGTSLDDDFDFIGSSDFDGAGQVRTYVSGGSTYIAINTDDDFSTVEMMIVLSGTIAMEAEDFIL